MTLKTPVLTGSTAPNALKSAKVIDDIQDLQLRAQTLQQLESCFTSRGQARPLKADQHPWLRCSPPTHRELDLLLAGS